jgi:hypothetical protein
MLHCWTVHSLNSRCFLESPHPIRIRHSPSNDSTLQNVGMIKTTTIAHDTTACSCLNDLFVIPIYLQSVTVHSANCVKLTVTCRRVLTSALL